MQAISDILGLQRLEFIRNWNDSLLPSVDINDFLNNEEELIYHLLSSPTLPESLKRYFIQQYQEHKNTNRNTNKNLLLPNPQPKLRLPSYQLLRSVIGHRNAAYCLKFDKTGQIFVTGGDDSLLKIWSTEWATLLHSPRGHEEPISDITICPFNEILASSSLDGYISLWDLRSGRPLFTINAFSSVTMLQFQPKVAQNRREPLVLMAACSDGYVKYWAVCPHTKTLKNTMPFRLNCKNGARDEIRVCTFTSGGLKVITGTKDGLVRISDVPTLDEIMHSSSTPSLPPTTPPSLLNHVGHINTISTSSNSSKFLTGSSDGTVKEWTFGDDLLSVLNDKTGWSTPFNFNTSPFTPETPRKVTQTLYIGENDEFFVAAINGTNELLIYSSLKPFKEPLRIERHHGEVYTLSQHPLYPLIFMSAGCDGQAFIWCFKSPETVPEVLFEFYLPGIRFLDGQFGPGGEEVVLVDDHGRFHLIGSVANYSPLDYNDIPCSQFFPSDLLTLLAPSLAEQPCTLRRNHQMRSVETGMLINDHQDEDEDEDDVSKASNAANVSNAKTAAKEIISYEKRQKITPPGRTFYLSLLDSPSLKADPYYSGIDQLSRAKQAKAHRLDLFLKEREASFRFQQMTRKPSSSRRPVLFGSDVEDGDEVVGMLVRGGANDGGIELIGRQRQRTPIIVVGADDDDDGNIIARTNLLFNETDTDLSPSSNSPQRQSRRLLRRGATIEDDAVIIGDGEESEEYVDGDGESSLSERRRLRRRQIRQIRREERRERRRRRTALNDATSAYRTSVRRRRSNSTSTTTRSTKNIVQQVRNEDILAWQTSSARPTLANILPYNPQIGDKVVVIRGGFKEYHDCYSDASAAKLSEEDSLPFSGEFFKGQIRDVVWDISCKGQRRQQQSPMVTLFFTDMLNTVTYSDKEGLADWVLPEFLFDASMSEEHMSFLSGGEEILLNFGGGDGDNGGNLKEGRITVCSQRTLKRSPWKSIRCSFDGGESNDLFSPWEVFGYGESLKVSEAGGGGASFTECEEVGRRFEEFISQLPEADGDLVEMVDFAEFPTYLSVIAYPLSLGLIRDRLLNAYYRSVEQVIRELSLFYENVIKFNRSKSTIARRAKMLKDHLLVYVESLKGDGSFYHGRRRLRRIPPLPDVSVDVDDILGGGGGSGRSTQSPRSGRRSSSISGYIPTSQTQRTIGVSPRRGAAARRNINPVESPLRRLTPRASTPYRLRNTITSSSSPDVRRGSGRNGRRRLVRGGDGYGYLDGYGTDNGNDGDNDSDGDGNNDTRRMRRSNRSTSSYYEAPLDLQEMEFSSDV